MQKSLAQLEDKQLAAYIENRWKKSSTAWSELEKRQKTNLEYWQNNPPWLKDVKSNRSRARASRLFMDLEHVNNFLTARPSQPLALSGNYDDTGKEFVSDLQKYLVEANRARTIKRKIKRALRQLYFSRLFCIKIVWNTALNDWDLKNCDPKKVRFKTTASVEEETDWIVEEVTEPISQFLSMFSVEQREAILRLMGKTEEQVTLNDEDVTYKEAWIETATESLLVHVWNNQIVSKVDNPYWDFTGVKLTSEEAGLLEKTGGKARRAILSRAKERQEGDALTETYLYNHFERPRKPYIIGTIFDTEQKAVGDTDYFEQGVPLQDNIDERMRQVSDNARLMNGVWLIDQAATNMTKAQASQIRAEAEGYILAPGAPSAIRRDTGAALPNFILDDLEKSKQALDEVVGTPPSFRGVREGQETAQGRAILRDQSLGRMDELVEFIDWVYQELYNWQIQLMKTRYTERHFRRVLGADNTAEEVELLQDDFDNNLEIRVVPGQTIPEDKVYKAAKAAEDLKLGVISPLKYLEDTGCENPHETLKQAVMYQQNPLTVLNFTPDELAKLQGGATPPEEEGGGPDRAAQIRQAREILESPEFQSAPPEEQARIVDELEAKFPELKQQ